MSVYKIPVLWQVWGIAEVEADSVEEAVELASSWETPLPKTSEYIDDSFEVDVEGILFQNSNLTDKDIAYLKVQSVEDL